jgi:hypothetical protein
LRCDLFSSQTGFNTLNSPFQSHIIPFFALTLMSLSVESFSSPRSLPAPQASVIRTLLYFDIFNHPLKSQEIFQLSRDKELSEEDVIGALEELCFFGLVQHAGGFYFVNNNTGAVEKRLRGEKLAAASMHTAGKYTKRIARFPFVRAVTLSGSLSKNYMDSTSDIDYFIITAPGRMWLARTLLVLYKKIFLLNSRKYFCVNYFLSEDALEVPDKNIFTATEVSFLLPTYNYALYRSFRNANSWSNDFLPHFPLRQKDSVIAEKKYSFKAFLEKVLSGSAGEKLDNYFFRLTLKFWKKKFRHFDDSTFDFRLRSRKNVSKHHPLGFQEKVLSGYSERIAAFTRAHHISLHAEDTVYA